MPAPRGRLSPRPARAAPLFWLLALLPGCADSGAPGYRVATPAALAPGRPVHLRMQEAGLGADVERARRVLAALFAAPGAAAWESAGPPLRDLPAPAGCAWVSLPDDLGGVLGFATPLGRLALCRVDDGADLTLEDFEQVVFQEIAGERGLRLVLRPGRRRALETLTCRARDAVLLFVREDEALFAARLAGPLAGDVLVVGLPGGAPPPVLAERMGS
ncbi:MAG: hypothetical protein HY812_15515 [Planctomycetes bacterium]|nr:hypothetical protein [Planctomycetota bacterium]